MIDTGVLRQQLRFWSVHVGLTALPSFCFALLAFNSPPAVAGMLAGIVTFIAGYTLLGSLKGYRAFADRTLVGRAVRMGARARVIVSLVSGVMFLPVLGNSFALVNFAPDYWAGWAAVLFVDGVSSLLGASWNLSSGSRDFLPTYLVTVTEGVILSFTLLLFSFLALVLLTMRQNRRPASPASPAGAREEEGAGE